MSKLIIPKTTTAYRETAVPKAADLLFDTDLNKMVIGDGVTPGGIVINASGGTASSEVTGGFGINVVDNEVSLKRFDAIESLVSGGTVQAGHAYKLNATSASGTTIYAEWFANGTFARDPAHIEIMVNGVGYLHLGQKTTAGSETAPFVLVGALEPDAMNNVTVRFHDGVAVMTVEDHIGGYVVISGGTSQSTAGTLPYALVNTGSDASPYITFSSELNGTTFDVTGVTVTTERHVVGNGYDETKITGDVNVGTSGTLTMAAVGLQNVNVVGGTMTLGDAFIPSGSTVAVSGGGLAVEKVTGAGETSVIDLGGTKNIATAPIVMSGVLVTNGHAFGSTDAEKNGGGLFVSGTSALIQNCVFSGNHADRNGGAIATDGATSLNLSNCVFENNVADFGGFAVHITGGTATMTDCTLKSQNVYTIATPFLFKGSNTLTGNAICRTDGTHSVSISSDATLDLTGNTNATPIAPGGGITFEPGGATVYPSAGSDSAYVLGGMTVPTIGNTNVIDLGGTNVKVASSGSAYASGCTFSGGSATDGGAIMAGGPATLFGCVITGCVASNGGGLYQPYEFPIVLEDCVISGNTCTMGNYYGGGGLRVGYATINNCVVSGNSAYNGQDILITGPSVVINGSTIGGIRGARRESQSTFGVTLLGSNKIDEIAAPYAGSATFGVTISSGASINLTSSIAPGGGITVLTGGCTVNGNAIPAGTYTSIDSTGTPT